MPYLCAWAPLPQSRLSLSAPCHQHAGNYAGMIYFWIITQPFNAVYECLKKLKSLMIVVMIINKYLLSIYHVQETL